MKKHLSQGLVLLCIGFLYWSFVLDKVAQDYFYLVLPCFIFKDIFMSYNSVNTILINIMHSNMYRLWPVNILKSLKSFLTVLLFLKFNITLKALSWPPKILFLSYNWMFPQQHRFHKIKVIDLGMKHIFIYLSYRSDKAIHS